MTPSPEAIAAARAADTKWRIPASVQLAQWALESGWGSHVPGMNPFGMKPRVGKNDPCQQVPGGSEWDAKKRAYVSCTVPLRIFPTIAAAFDAHAQLIATAPVYAAAMGALPDEDRFIDRMAAHYATDPLYASKLKAVIRGANLGRYDA